MMLQRTGPTLADVSCGTLTPGLTSPGHLTLDDFTDFCPTVRDELRLSIQTRRQSDGLGLDLGADLSSDGASSSSDLHPETGGRREMSRDELDRRKRRRERNKIAAAKCRNKKKEKTETLQKESEKLESVNTDLKSQIQTLKQQKQQLVYMLNLHRPTCIVRAQNGQTPEDERNLFIQHIKESSLQIHGLLSDPEAPLDASLLTLDHVQCL
ncbi:cyclic AMP-dependent transcription factor ATF-3 [Neosynchiropus ocellatus]